MAFHFLQQRTFPIIHSQILGSITLPLISGHFQDGDKYLRAISAFSGWFELRGQRWMREGVCCECEGGESDIGIDWEQVDQLEDVQSDGEGETMMLY